MAKSNVYVAALVNVARRALNSTSELLLEICLFIWLALSNSFELKVRISLIL